MNENIDLTKILKDCPTGTKLYSPLFGEVEFDKLEATDNIISIITTNRQGGQCVRRFFSNGVYFSNYSNTECMLFPSRDNRDWSTFKVPESHQHFEPYQKVLIPDAGIWSADLYSNPYGDGHKVVGVKYTFKNDEVIPYEGNEDKLGKEVEE